MSYHFRIYHGVGFSEKKGEESERRALNEGRDGVVGFRKVVDKKGGNEDEEGEW